jgi:tryptophan synthase alpha chain
MNTIDSVFKQPSHKALIAYITIGYPSIDATLKAIPLLADSGCDIIEMGIPFSDPLADGVTIQKASYQTIKNGVTTKSCMDIAKELSRKTSIPLAFMTYYNPVFKYGLDKFCSDCCRSGVNGLIIPDLTPDEGSHLESISQKNNLNLVYLLSPSSTDRRINLVAERSQGVIYLVSVTGITGTRTSISSDLNTFVSRVRKIARQPLCVGFGISSPEQAKRIAQIADGVIIGSKIIQLMETDRSLKSTSTFIRQVRDALDSPSVAII